MSVEIKTIVDDYISLPNDVKLHILFNEDTRTYADQYATALHVARGIPFNLSALPITDPFVLLISNIFQLKDGNQALAAARSYYESWAYEIQKHAWTLALLEDNDFTNIPAPYVDEKKRPARGIPVVPEPKFDIANPVEYRLKQLIDLLEADISAQMQVTQIINDAFAGLVQNAGTEETDKNGFHGEPVNSDVHDEAVPDNDNSGDRRSLRKKK